ncbi:Alpha/Beta hydrolase protein [Phycomyces nitens]|nr:Alpha/Beta hydrolase protein [Phycomyces nitens]
MKFTLLSVVSVVFFFVLSPISIAAPTLKDSFAISPTIAEPASPQNTNPKTDLFSKKLATPANAPLPDNTKQVDTMALNSSTVNLERVNSGISRRSNFYASTAKVNELKVYTQLSANAYCRSVVPLNQWACKHCSKGDILVSTFKAGSLDTNGFISRNDRRQVITLVFRGTSSFKNIVADFDFASQEYPPVEGAEVHHGFYKAYMEVQDEVLTGMTHQISAYPNYRVVVTGHSLGGALATLAGLDLYQRDSRFNPNRLSIITYGGPRVGNSAFAYYVTDTGISLERVVHKQDAVPHVPPQAFGFLHPGIEYWIEEDDRVKICDSELDSPECSDSIVPFTKLSDHISYFDIDIGICT